MSLESNLHPLRLRKDSHCEESSAFAGSTKGRPLRVVVLDSPVRTPGFLCLRKLADVDEVMIASDAPDFPNIVSFLSDPSLPLGVRICDGQHLSVFRVPPDGWYGLWLKRDEYLRERMLIAAANQHNLDILVMEHAPIDVGFWPAVYRTANILTPEEALPYVALFLRSRGTYVTDCRSYLHLVNAGGFYWELMRALIPASWPWLSSCLEMEKQGDSVVGGLAQSVLQRVDQALRARDRLLVQVQLPQNNDTGDEIRFCLDMLLLTLSGAVDSLALCLDRIYRLNSSPTDVAFSRSGWLKRLQEVAPKVSGLLQIDGGRHQLSLNLLASLRNTIHRMAVQTSVIFGPAHSTGTGLFLESDRYPKVAENMEAAGVSKDWTLNEWAGGNILVDPARCTETLTTRIASFVNEVMTVTIFPQPVSDPANFHSRSGGARKGLGPSPETRHLLDLAGIKS
jgi:hypothetical protein